MWLCRSKVCSTATSAPFGFFEWMEGRKTGKKVYLGVAIKESIGLVCFEGNHPPSVT